MGPKYSSKEMELFSEFANVSTKFFNFQYISHALDDISEKDDDEREEAIEQFHKELSSSDKPRTVRNFDKLISLHSPQYVGSRFFLLASNGIKNIEEVDHTHIPITYVPKIKDKFTAEKFGAIIHGYKPIMYNIDKIEEEQGYEHSDHYDLDNWDLSTNLDMKTREARDEFDSLNDSFKEASFVVGSKAKNIAHNASKKAQKVYSAHKGTCRRAAAIALAVAALIGGGKQVAKEVQAHNLSVNSSTQYEQTITDDTKEYLNKIMEDLNIQSDSLDPQKEDLESIEGRIDLVLDYIISDQVKTAFEEYHEGYTVKDVETWFNKKYQGISEPQDYQFIDVTYIDKDGKEGTERISEFRSEFLTENHLSDNFELEETIDLDSPIASAFTLNGTKNYLTYAQSREDVINYLQDAAQKAEHYAAFGVKHGHSLFGTPYLKSTLPDEKTENTIDDDGR